MKTANFCVILTCLTLSTSINCVMQYIKQSEVESSKEARPEVYEHITYLNELTGDFATFSQENVIFMGDKNADYKDPTIAHRWYRKRVLQKEGVLRMNKSLARYKMDFMKEDKAENEDPFATTIVYEICITLDDNAGYVIYLAFDHGMSPISNMAKIPDFMAYLKDPRNRLTFYMRLLGLVKRLVEKLGVRLSVFSPFGIGLTKRRVGCNSDLEYYPVVRDYTHVVKLEENMESGSTMFNPTSVIYGAIEPEAKYQQRIEIFSVGMLIYSMEVYYADVVYQNHESETVLPEWLLSQKPSQKLVDEMKVKKSEPVSYKFSMEGLLSKTMDIEESYRTEEGTLPKDYSNAEFKNNLRFLRQCCGKYFEMNPVVNVAQDVNYVNFMNMNSSMDVNAYMTEMYNNFFVVVDSMTNQNNTNFYQRPTYDEGIAKISDILGKMNAVLQQVPQENLVFNQERLLLI